MDLRKCPKCDSLIDKRSRICGVCGTTLPVQSNLELESPARSADQPILSTDATGLFSNEDDRILAVARSQCELLGITDKPVTKLRWREYVGGQRIEPDNCKIIGPTLILPATMKGKLQPEEWRPLILSELIHRRQFGTEISHYVRKRFLIGLIIILSLSILFLITIVHYGASIGVSALRIGLVDFMGILIVLMIAMKLSGPLNNKLMLRSDSKAAQIVTKEEFVRVLTKINAEASETRMVEDRSNRKRFNPSLVDRIRNLSG